MKVKEISVILGICSALSFFACKKEPLQTKDFEVSKILVGSDTLSFIGINNQIQVSDKITIIFSNSINQNSFSSGIQLTSSGGQQDFTLSYPDPITVVLNLKSPLEENTSYSINLNSTITNTSGKNLKTISYNFTTSKPPLKISSFQISNKEFINETKIINVDLNATFKIRFNQALNPASVNTNSLKIFSSSGTSSLQFFLSDSNRLVTIVPDQPLKQVDKYFLTLSTLIQSYDNTSFGGFSKYFYTTIDSTLKFPLISDDELMDKVQKNTFSYFWDFGHPVSGLARERNTSGDVVTIGGSGFGLMSIIVGIERQFITRAEGIERFSKIINFLKKADRFHGAFPHWMNGNTGKTIPFSTNDNGADLVETSYLVQGLLTVRAYLNPSNSTELTLINSINEIWEGVEWDWFTKGNQNVLYWHWSPDKAWSMNVQIKGWNECLITYFLAAASPTHSINSNVYHQGWAGNGNMKNGNSYYNINLPLGESFGGPLFFAHYSFLGLDPRNLSDTYANYWDQNTNHSKINLAYCIANPNKFPLYGENCWGLTASDNSNGYSAHSPTNDKGVISPTAAISSIPYTPDASLKALKFYYYILGDKLFKNYGFVDAFDVSNGWFASSFLAIDQGPIIIMIENYRTQLLWDLFMSNPEIIVSKNKLGFK